jgi:hypothetical protein
MSVLGALSFSHRFTDNSQTAGLRIVGLLAFTISIIAFALTAVALYTRRESGP